MSPFNQPKPGRAMTLGKARAKRARFLSQSKAAFNPPGMTHTSKQGFHGVAHRGFLVKQHEHRTILWHSPGAGKGRGHGHHARGYHLSAATRAKISAALKGKHHPHKGGAQSAATKARISASLKKYYSAHPGAGKARAVKAAATRKSRGEKAFGGKHGKK